MPYQYLLASLVVHFNFLQPLLAIQQPLLYACLFCFSYVTRLNSVPCFFPCFPRHETTALLTASILWRKNSPEINKFASSRSLEHLPALPANTWLPEPDQMVVNFSEASNFLILTLLILRLKKEPICLVQHEFALNVRGAFPLSGSLWRQHTSVETKQGRKN